MTASASDDIPVRRIDRVLAFMSLGLVALSILCFFAIMIGTAADQDQTAGIWPTVGVIVWTAPPLALVSMLTVLVMSFVRKARAGRGQ